MVKNKTQQAQWISNLRYLMETQNYNPRSLSLEAGLNPTAVRDMLEGRTRFPRYDTVLALSKALSVTPSRLMGEPLETEEKKEPTPPKQDEDLELLTEIIARLHEVAEDYQQQLEPRDIAAMTATLYRQLQKEAAKTDTQALKPRLADLMAYETLRRGNRRAS